MISGKPYLIYFEPSFPDNVKDSLLPDKMARAKSKEKGLAWVI